MGNSYTRGYNNNNNKLPNIKGEIIIDDDNDILFHTYKDVLHIKYTNKYRMNYDEFIAKKIYLLQNIVNLFNHKTINDIKYEIICDELKYIHNIEQWEKFVFNEEYDKLININFKDFDLFLLKNYKIGYIKFKNNRENLINFIINSKNNFEENNGSNLSP